MLRLSKITDIRKFQHSNYEGKILYLCPNLTEEETL